MNKKPKIQYDLHAYSVRFRTKREADDHISAAEKQGYLTNYQTRSSYHLSSVKHTPHVVNVYYRDKQHKKETRAQKRKQNKLSEQAPTNSIGTGNIAGAGVGAAGEPGVTAQAIARYKSKNKLVSLKRKTFAQFVRGK